MKQSDILGQFGYVPKLDGEMQTDRLLVDIAAGKYHRLSLKEYYIEMPEWRRSVLCEELLSALRIGQLCEGQKNFAKWIDEFDDVISNLRKAEQHLKFVFNRVPIAYARDIPKHYLEWPIRHASYRVNEEWSNEQHQGYSSSAAERMSNALDAISETRQLFGEYNSQRRQESQNPGEPGKIGFIMRLCESWLKFTGRNPAKTFNENAPFMKFVNFAWYDLGGGQSERDFNYAARKGVEKYLSDPKDYPIRQM